MMRTLAAVPVVVALWILAAPSVRAAGENQDLELIPAVPPEADGNAPGSGNAAPAITASGRFYIENALTTWSVRDNPAVPMPPSAGPALTVQNRTSLDGRHDWDLGDNLTATLSDRLNVYVQDNIPMPSHQDYRNDFREGYLTWEPAPLTYLEMGRINVRNGVALGFNPTDFFKTRTLLDQASEDPSVLREDRLGTVMVRGQAIFASGSASIAFAPKLTAPGAVYTGAMPSLDPMFDRTNGSNRLLVTSSYNLIPAVSSELLYDHDDGQDGGQDRFGADFSRPIGTAVIAYAEWAGGRQSRLVDAAGRYGRQTGSLPATAPDLLSAGHGESFMNDAAIGASWTGVSKLTVNFEYHYHQAGLSGRDWHNLVAAGDDSADASLAAGEFWYLRAYAQDQQEPLSRQELFLRADWTDAFVPDLELSAFAVVDAYDGSALSQLSATYFLSDRWTVGGLASVTTGGPHSDYGSLRQARSIILQLIRYF